MYKVVNLFPSLLNQYRYDADVVLFRIIFVDIVPPAL